jgi:SAM-dependent methyltransferase
LQRLPWPLPALLAWGGAWALFTLLMQLGLSGAWALALASAGAAACSLWGRTWWRRGLIAAGFPLSLALSGTLALPAWAWLLPLVLLLLVYPLNAWRDAPLFPTPARALQGLAEVVPLPEGALVLDAGCGLGHGLQALRRAYPQARLQGLEWSWPLRAVCALRCPWARVRQGDIWRADWAPYAMVYLFQRPESMARAWEKAQAQMPPGSWMVSLEFEVAGVRATGRLQAPDGRPVWLYRVVSAR